MSEPIPTNLPCPEGQGPPTDTMAPAQTGPVPGRTAGPAAPPVTPPPDDTAVLDLDLLQRGLPSAEDPADAAEELFDLGALEQTPAPDDCPHLSGATDPGVLDLDALDPLPPLPQP